jgi:ribose 5-phosphate isomerase A
MTNSMTPADTAKRAAAARALEMVEDGMSLGLGTGSTAAWFVRLLSERIQAEGLSVVGVPTSNTTMWLARELGIPVTTLETAGRLDLTVDGADEFDPRLDLIKGGGAALLQEKIVATASSRMVVITDAGKRVEVLGRFPLPVEVVRFGWTATRDAIATLLAGADVDGREIVLRQNGSGPLVTDEGHHILDLKLGRIGDPPTLAAALNAVPGVVESGLFVGIAQSVVIGYEDGRSEVIGRGDALGALEQMRNDDA